MKNKDQSIETLRGVAIILVVAGYIIRGDLDHQITSGITSFLDFLYYFLKPIRMPLFTVISAYLYASSPVTQETFKKLVTGKGRRVLIPYFVVSAMQYTFFSILDIKGAHPMQEIFRIYLWPFEQFWFLWAIFWIFMGVGLLDSLKALDTKTKWLGWLALSIGCYFLLELPRFMAARGIVYLMPFFLMGYGIRRFANELFTAKMIKVYQISALLAYAAYLSIYTDKIAFKDQDQTFKILALWVSFSVVPLIFHFRPTIPALAQIGYYAFGIHIFNKISSALPRMVFEHFHVYNEILIVAVYLICAIAFSIGIQIVLEQFSLTRRFILGMKDPPKSNVPVMTPESILPAISDVPQTVLVVPELVKESMSERSPTGKDTK